MTARTSSFFCSVTATALLSLASANARAANSPPTIEDPGLSTDEDVPLEVTLKANDLDRDKLQWHLAKPAKNGTSSVELDGTLRYQPKDDFNGKDEVTVEATDGKSKSTKKLTISVSSVNDPPSASVAPLRGTEDKRVSGQISAKDPDKDPLIFSVLTQPPAGEAKVDGGGKIEFNPAPNQSGTVTFDVRMTDGSVDVSVPVTVVLEPVNDAPTLKGQNLQTQEDVPLKGALTAEDPDREPLSWTLSDKPVHGAVELDASKGHFIYTPAKEYAGEDGFSLTVSDGKQSAKARVEVTVQNVNDPPTIQALALEGNEDEEIKAKVIAKDWDGDVIYFKTQVEPKNGEAEIDHESGALSYTPKANFFGTDTVVVEASDIAGGVTTAVKITVKPVNDAPEVRTASAKGDEDQPISGKLTATDVDKDALVFSLVKGPKSGSVEVKADGGFRFTPAANVHGEEAFSFEVTDGKAKVQGTHALVVRPVNDAPVAADVAVETQEDKPVRGKLAATDVDKDALSFTLGKSAKKGAVEVDEATGAFVYTPNANENGADAFTIVASDGPAQVEATVRVQIAPVNDGPLAQALEKSGEEDHVLQGEAIASDVDKDVLTYTVTSKPRAGAVEMDARTGAWRYTPNAQSNGADAFRFEVTDGKLRASADVKLTIAAVNDAPEPKPLALTTQEEKAVTGAVSASDIDKDSLTFTLSQPAKRGVATVDAATGRVSYAPNLNENGEDSFGVEVSDGKAKTPLTVTVAIAPVNDAPVASAHDKSGTEDRPITGTLLAADVDKDTLSYTVTGRPRHGTVAVDAAAGTYSYTPNKDEHGDDSFRFEVSDGKLRSSADVKLAIAAQNDAPVPSDASVTTSEDKDASGKVAALDVDKDTLTFRLKKAPVRGVAWVDDASGAFRYAPRRDVHGKDSFVIEVTDGFVSADATVSVEVSPAPDAPVVDVRPIECAEDAPATAALAAFDADGDVVRFKVLTQPRIASVEIDADGKTLRITPKPEQHGEDIVVLEATDGPHRVKASVPVLVAARNDAPTLDAVVAETPEETAVVLALVAHDRDGDAVKVALDDKSVKAAPGSVTLTGHVMRVTPRLDFAGPLSFDVIPSDTTGAGAPLRVTVTVTNVNDAPIAKDIALVAAPGVAQKGAVEASDTDAGDELTFSIAVPPRHGAVTLDDPRSGRFSYTPADGAHGDDSFRVRVKDKAGASVTATVRVTLKGVASKS